MTLGPLMLDVAGCELDPEERELLCHPAVGGVILFSRNYASPQQLRALVNDIHTVRDPHLLVAVDQEGGRVQRFRDGFTRLPPLACLGQIYDADRTRAKHLARVTGWLMASELRAVGVDISFAPVLDLDYGMSTVIGNRALHGAPRLLRTWRLPTRPACTMPAWRHRQALPGARRGGGGFACRSRSTIAPWRTSNSGIWWHSGA